MGLLDDPQFVPHILRHTCASRLMQAGVPMPEVQKWLGHSSISETMRYSHLAPDSIFNAVLALED
jgi:integrase